jgi:hypothetical protein
MIESRVSGRGTCACVMGLQHIHIQTHTHAHTHTGDEHPYLNQGIWQGHITFESGNAQSGSGYSENKQANIFIRALLEGSPLARTTAPSRSTSIPAPNAAAAVEASPADVTWGAREMQGQQQPSLRDRSFPPHGRLPPPAAAAAAFNTPDAAGTEAGSFASSSSSSVGRGGAEDEQGGGSGHAPVARALFQDAATGPVAVVPGSLGSSPSRFSKSYALQVASPLNDVPVCTNSCTCACVVGARGPLQRVGLSYGGWLCLALALPARARCRCPSNQDRCGGRVRSLMEAEVATTPLDPCHTWLRAYYMAQTITLFPRCGWRCSKEHIL